MPFNMRRIRMPWSTWDNRNTKARKSKLNQSEKFEETSTPHSETERQLENCIREGDLPQVRKILKNAKKKNNSIQHSMVNPCELAAFCGQMKIMTLCLQYCSFDVQKVIHAAVKNDHLDCMIAVLMEHNYVFTSDDCVLAAMHNSYYSMIFMLESIYLHDLTSEILEMAFVCGHFMCFIAALRHGCPLPFEYRHFYDVNEISKTRMNGFYLCFKFAVKFGVSDFLLIGMMDWMTVVGVNELSKKLYAFCKKKGRTSLINPTILDDALDVL